MRGNPTRPSARCGLKRPALEAYSYICRLCQAATPRSAPPRLPAFLVPLFLCFSVRASSPSLLGSKAYCSTSHRSPPSAVSARGRWSFVTAQPSATQIRAHTNTACYPHRPLPPRSCCSSVHLPVCTAHALLLLRCRPSCHDTNAPPVAAGSGAGRVSDLHWSLSKRLIQVPGPCVIAPNFLLSYFSPFPCFFASSALWFYFFSCIFQLQASLFQLSFSNAQRGKCCTQQRACPVGHYVYITPCGISPVEPHILYRAFHLSPSASSRLPPRARKYGQCLLPPKPRRQAVSTPQSPARRGHDTLTSINPGLAPFSSTALSLRGFPCLHILPITNPRRSRSITGAATSPPPHPPTLGARPATSSAPPVL